MRRGLWTPNLGVMALAAAVLTGGILGWASQSGHERSLAQQETEITKLQGELQHQRQATAVAVDQNVSKALGVTTTRLNDDGAIITSFLSTAFTWDSGEAYERARASLRNKYGLANDDAFLQDLMPSALYTKDGQGTKHYLFDERGMRASFGAGAEVVVLKVIGTRYQYVVMADIAFKANRQVTNGRGDTATDPSVTRRVLLWITVDGEGTVSDLSGVPAAGTTRSSH